MTFGRRWVVAVATAVVLVSPGCADDPQPEFAPPSESPTSASSTPSQAPTKAPWEKKTTAGAVAFAKHWIDVFSDAMNSGDSAGLRALSSPTCASCSAIADRIDAIQRRGGFYRSPGWKILHAVPSGGVVQGEASLDLRVLQGQEEFKEAAGSEVVRNPESRATYSATVRWSDDGWQLTELRLLA